ncbi:reverse transcriptase [Lasius niger]|uniref:Reverse transcriptase n=1 Tax=Lasius niger TaxID=67767 RepID=A0A0J7K6Z5_LASNI|nr:reverse transcriptase [Lasius niger]
MPSSRFLPLILGSPPSSYRRRPGKEGIPAQLGPWGCQPLRPVLVGPNTRSNQASDNGEGPFGQPTPATSPIPGPAKFRCKFPGCDRTFRSNRGRGVHNQRVHKDWYDAQIQVPAEQTRWTTEEVGLLARIEVELVSGGQPPRFIDQELLGFFAHRSLEAIKGRRKRQDYRDLVETLLQQNESEAESDSVVNC